MISAVAVPVSLELPRPAPVCLATLALVASSHGARSSASPPRGAAALVASVSTCGAAAARRRARNAATRGAAASTAARGVTSTFFAPVGDGGAGGSRVGARLEVLGGPAERAAGEETAGAATLLLIHGSYHAAWCWEPHFLDFFRARGHDTYALSLRGQGRGTVAGDPPPVAGTLEQHAADVVEFIVHLHSLHGRPVAILGHSFGGLIVQRAVADLTSAGSEAVAGMALLASVPPSGNGPLVWRYLFRDPWLAAKITWGFAARAFEGNAALCRELFLGQDLDDASVATYMKEMRASTPPGTRLLDLRALQSSLPVPTTAMSRPVLVFGGDADAIVDRDALDETAAAHGTEAVVLPGIPHDAMLCPRWREVAETIHTWLLAKPCS